MIKWARERLSIILGAAMVIFFALMSRFFFPTQYFSDSLLYCYYVEKAILAPSITPGICPIAFAHIFQNLFYYLVIKFLGLFGFHGRVLVPLQILSIIFSIMAVITLYLIILRLFKEPVSAFLTGGILGAGYSFWYWSGQTKSYPMSTFFVLLAFYLFLILPDWRGIVLTSLCSALAVGFFQGTLPFVLIMAVYIFLWFRNFGRRILNSAIYLVLTCFFILIIYYASFSMTVASIHPFEGHLRGVWHEFWNPISSRSIPGGAWIFSQTSSISYYFSQLSCLLKNIVSEAFVPSGDSMDWAINTVLNTSERVLILNRRVDLAILIGILIIIFIFLMNFRKIWNNHWKIIVFSIIWTLLFIGTYFIIHAVHPYIYICAVGLIIFIGCIAAYSITVRVIMGIIFALLLLANSHQIIFGHRPDDGFRDLQRVESIVKKGDCFITGVYNDHYFGPYDHVNYYFFTRLIEISEDEASMFLLGRFPENIAEKIKTSLEEGKQVFINKTGFLESFPEEHRNSVWKVVTTKFLALPAFTYTLHPTRIVMNYYMLKEFPRR